jgi:outer membrane lipoprotein-sorting protein
MSEREHASGEAARLASGGDAQEEQMRTVLTAAYPAREPSEALRQRVAELAARHDSRTVGTAGRMVRRWAPLRLALGMAAATVLAFVLVGLVPTWTAAQVLRRAEAAMEGVRNAHVITWRVAADGRRRKASESWYQGDHYRSEELPQGRIQVFAGGKLWTYEPKLNKVTVRRRDSPFGYAPSGFSLKSMARDFARWGWRDRIRVLGDATLHGRAARQVVIERAVEPVRILVTVDAVTDLPIESTVQLRQDGKWTTQATNEHRFDERLPKSLFAPTFPKSATLFDADEGQAFWERRLAKGIARQHVGDREIVIRDLQVNSEGDVFVLYTAGKYLADERATGNYLAGRDWKIKLEDEFGTVYLWHGGEYWPTMAKPHPRLPNGYVFNGERIEGDWWTPLEPQSPWKPRKFTLRFLVSPENVHGARDEPRVQAQYTEKAVFTLPVDKPATALIPDYMPYMAHGPWQAHSLRRGQAQKRAHYYRFEQEDLPRAVEYYHQILRERDERARETGQPSFDTQTWFDLGQSLHRLGRKEEARAAYEQAVREAIYPGYPRDEARKALEALKADLSLQRGSRPPAFSATDLDGQRQSPARYQGQVLVIDFWQPGGKGWLSERKRLKALYEKYHDSGLAVLSVSLSEDRDQLREIVKEHQLA